MPSAIVIGGGLAGLATAAALGDAGFDVDLFESRSFLGGRATSYALPGSGGEEDAEIIDNCQHVLLRCCVNLLDLYRRLGVEDKIRFHPEYFFIEPGGRTSVLKRGIFPAPAQFAGSFLGLHFLDLPDKLGIALAMRAIARDFTERHDLDRITMLDWLHEKEQTPHAIERYWRQVLVSAVNEELDRMAASHGLQVFFLGMLAGSNSYEMGLAAVPLRELYSDSSLTQSGNVRIHHRAPVTAIDHTPDTGVTAIHVPGERVQTDYFISCLPFERLQTLMPELPVAWSAFEHSPITGIHLWFDRPITDLPTPPCSTVPFSGCSTRVRAATYNLSSARRAPSQPCPARR